MQVYNLAHIFHLVISRSSTVLMGKIHVLGTVFCNWTERWEKVILNVIIFNTGTEITVVVSDIYWIMALKSYLSNRKHLFDGKSVLLSKFILKIRKYSNEWKKPNTQEHTQVLSFKNSGQVLQENVSNTHMTRTEFRQVTAPWCQLEM